jgi:hypothetical protein
MNSLACRTRAADVLAHTIGAAVAGCRAATVAR